MRIYSNTLFDLLFHFGWNIFWEKYYGDAGTLAKKGTTIQDIESLYKIALEKSNTHEPLAIMEHIDISNIEGVNFIEPSGRKYSITLESLKKIAVYIQGKYHKTSFAPNELMMDAEYFFKNYHSTLPPEQYQILENALKGWIASGGEFHIEQKDVPVIIPQSRNRFLTLRFFVGLPFIIYFSLWAICILDIVLMSTLKISVLGYFTGGMHGFYAILYLILGFWVPFAISIPIFIIGVIWKVYKTGRFFG